MTPPTVATEAEAQPGATEAEARPSATPARFDGDGFLTGPGAPDRSACAADSDCVVTSVPNQGAPQPPASSLGCCASSGHASVSRAYFDWVRAWQARYCPATPECPPLPPPAMPAPCVFEARCVAGRCGNACAAP